MIINLILSVLYLHHSHGLDLLAREECEQDPHGYIVPDPIYCDRFMECDNRATKTIKTCDLGKKFDLNSASCLPEVSVDCQERSKTWKVDHAAKRIRLLGGGAHDHHHHDDHHGEHGHGAEHHGDHHGQEDHAGGHHGDHGHEAEHHHHEAETHQVEEESFPSPFSRNNPRLSVFGSRTTQPPTTTPRPHPTTPSPQLSRSSESKVTVPHDPLADIPCEGQDVYVVPDPSHCDRFLSCPGHVIELCDEGFTLDTNTGFCEVRSSVECGDRHLNMRDNQKELEAKLQEKIRLLSQGQQISGDSQSESRTSSFSQPPSSTSSFSQSSSSIPDNTRLRASIIDQRLGGNSNLDSVSNTPGLSIVKNTFDIRVSSIASVPELSVDQVECDQGRSYKVADNEQCDKYAECEGGVKNILLCPDGFAFSLEKSQCDYLAKVDCSTRAKLQPAKSTALCPRENGYFPMPAEVSCDQYVDCRNGVGHVLSCGAGAVFDEVAGCVHPDQTSRPGCSAQEKYQFKCPTFGLTQRFGDHDRLPHPTDCSLFYACLSNGAPRLLSCQKPTVFNPETGFCEHQDKVPGCQGYYPPEQVVTEDREKLAQEIREQILREFNLSRRK